MKMISTSRMVPNCPNIDRRSGSRNRNGMLETCSRFGCAFDSAMAVAAATAAATLCAWACCCCCWAATWLANCWAVLSTVPVAVVVMAELAEVAQAVVSRPGLLLLLLLLAAAAIEELTADGSAGEVVLLLLLVMTLLLLLALETCCVSGSVCCNNSVILTVCCSIPFEAMALAAEADAPLAPPVVVPAEPADPGLLLAELTEAPPPPSDEGAIEDAMAAAAARDVATDDGTTPNTDAGELY